LGGGPKVALGLRTGGRKVCECEFRREWETDRRELVLTIDARRLLIPVGCWTGPLPLLCLAAEEAVCATRCAGRWIGRVGDLGRGLTKPVEDRVPMGVVFGALAGVLEDGPGFVFVIASIGRSTGFDAVVRDLEGVAVVGVTGGLA
jgi:hypothetical protein